MITFAKMWIPSPINTISICHYDVWKDGIGKTCVCSHKTSNLTSLIMETKEFQTTSCVAVRSPPWTQRSKCIHVRSMVWPHMHWEKLQIMGWGRFNLMCSAKEKTSKAI
jgi:hypothetical protein